MTKEKLFQQILIKNIICKTQSSYILLVFLLITIELAASVHCYLIKYQTEQSVPHVFFTLSEERNDPQTF